MEFWRKVKGLQLWKQRSFLLLAAVELVLLAAAIAGLFGRDKIYEYGPEDMKANFGVFSGELGGYTVDASMGQRGNLVDFNGIALPKGVYRVSLHYSTDADSRNMCTVTDDTVGYGALRTNGQLLYAAHSRTDFRMWLLEDTSQMIVHAVYEGEGSLTVTGLTIYETNEWNRMALFILVIIMLLVNGGYLYAQYDRRYRISKQDKNVAFGLGVILLFSSLPLCVDYLIGSGDLIYHLMRVEGIRDSLMYGQFPNRIAPEWQQGYGYASPVFYGETVLYLAGLLRAVGFTVLTSYQFFILIVNAATVLVSYYCFQKVFGEKYIGLLCSMLYTMSVYRIYKTYKSGSLGETLGMLFLPFLIYGFYRIFTQDIKSREYRTSWLPLTIGFTGLLQSHLLSGELAGAFTILLCIGAWKKVFRRETFLNLAKTVIYSCLLSAWFLVPFLDYMLTGDFVIHNVSARRIQERGLYPAHLLYANPVQGGTVFFRENGMYRSDPMGIGIALLAVLVTGLCLLYFRRWKDWKHPLKALGAVSCGFAVLACVLSLSAFPWDKIQFLNGLTQTLVSSLQFPNRFLTIATVLLTGVAGVIAKWLLDSGRRRELAAFGAGMTVLVVISSVYLLNDIMYTVNPTRIYNSQGMGTGYIAGAEYLPYGTDASVFTYREPVAEENILVEGYEKKGFTVDVSCSNNSGREGFLELPLLFYKGYTAFDMDTGEKLPVYAGNHSAVSVAVPAGYQGSIRTTFQSPWYWRAGEAVSVATFVVLAVLTWRKRKPGKAMEDKGNECAGKDRPGGKKV